jgi:hypothetical protein
MRGTDSQPMSILVWAQVVFPLLFLLQLIAKFLALVTLGSDIDISELRDFFMNLDFPILCLTVR